MESKQKKYYIPVEGQLIEVSEEVYKAYYQPIWRARYHAQKNGECRCPQHQLWQCEGICPGCQYHSTGKKVSIDTPIGSEDSGITLGDTLQDDAVSAIDLLIDAELLIALYEELDRLDPEGKRICELMMHHSEREAAAIMEMPRSTFKRHWAKARETLKEKLKDYYY